MWLLLLWRSFGIYRDFISLKNRRSRLDLISRAESAAKSPGYFDISRGDSIIELASLTARAAGTICNVPMLNFLKPAVGIAGVVCNMAKVRACLYACQYAYYTMLDGED
jgi:hypothetical protein